MALKPCRECKKEVAADATECPHCGCKGPVANFEVLFKGLVALVVLGTIAYTFFTS